VARTIEEIRDREIRDDEPDLNESALSSIEARDCVYLSIGYFRIRVATALQHNHRAVSA